MTIESKIILDSVSEDGNRLITRQLRYPRIIHAEVMTHRVFTRNASSSRAIPTAKLVQLALDDMYEPVRYGKNKSGMQAAEENLTGSDLAEAKAIWRDMANYCANGVARLGELKLHKQWANRPLEWFGHITVLITATEWDGFYEQRNHSDAQDEIEILAKMMLSDDAASTPRLLHNGTWHLPYVTDEEIANFDLINCIRMSGARCARVSYMNQEGKRPGLEEDVDRYNSLVLSKPAHMSPVEHQAMAVPSSRFFANFRGWKQHRWDLERNT